jgi:xanthine phosphoribosyltransferase
MQKIIYSWQQLETDAERLAENIGKGKYEAIIAITRGGLIPAYFLAKHLGIRVIHTLCLSSYEDQQQGKIDYHTIEGIHVEIDPVVVGSKKILFVDDIVDSGETMREIRKRFPECSFATLITRGKENPDYFVREENAWVQFPWETPGD